MLFSVLLRCLFIMLFIELDILINASFFCCIYSFKEEELNDEFIFVD